MCVRVCVCVCAGARMLAKVAKTQRILVVGWVFWTSIHTNLSDLKGKPSTAPEELATFVLTSSISGVVVSSSTVDSSHRR